MVRTNIRHGITTRHDRIWEYIISKDRMALFFCFAPRRICQGAVSLERSRLDDSLSPRQSSCASDSTQISLSPEG